MEGFGYSPYFTTSSSNRNYRLVQYICVLIKVILVLQLECLVNIFFFFQAERLKFSRSKGDIRRSNFHKKSRIICNLDKISSNLSIQALSITKESDLIDQISTILMSQSSDLRIQNFPRISSLEHLEPFQIPKIQKLAEIIFQVSKKLTKKRFISKYEMKFFNK